MKQQAFENKFSDDWQQLRVFLESKNANKKLHHHQFPPLYRQLCHQLALAKHRGYSPNLVDQLNDLTLRCHHRLYQHRDQYQNQFLKFIFHDFPNVLRKNSIFVALAIAFFALPFISVGLLCTYDTDIIYSVMPASQVRDLESMYDPASKALGRERESDSDLFMFGFYIKNNITVGFQTFAGGILFGLGSLFFLIYNGIFIGAALGHLTQVGYTDTFYPFVAGHGSFELTAIAFSGAAGLKLGYALINPGAYRRTTALRIAAKDAIKIVYGAILMLIVAAFIEAFWSSSTQVPSDVKYAVGGILWLLVIWYCLYCGKHRASNGS